MATPLLIVKAPPLIAIGTAQPLPVAGEWKEKGPLGLIRFTKGAQK